MKPVEVDKVKEWEVEKILNKRKIREIVKYLVWWKGFIAEHDIEEKELRKCERSNSRVWEEDKCRSETIEEVRNGRKKLLEKYMAKILYK